MISEALCGLSFMGQFLDPEKITFSVNLSGLSRNIFLSFSELK